MKMGFNPNELKAARVRRGLNQKKLAALLQTTPASYCMKENGSRPLSLEDVNRISETLGLSPHEISSIFFAEGFNSKGNKIKQKGATA